MANNLPPLFTCRICGEEVLPTGTDVYQKVCGWSESKPGAVTQTVTLAQQMHLYAHGMCVRMLKAGGQMKKDQGSLF